MKIHVVGGHELTGIPSPPEERDRIKQEIGDLRAAGRSAREHPEYRHEYNFTVDEWELADWVKAKLYHWYDMRVPPIRLWDKWSRYLPGDEDRVIGFSNEPARWFDRIKAWSISQDFRCFELSQRHTEIASFGVDEALYHRVFPEYRPKPPMLRRLRDTFRSTPTKEARVGSSAEPMTASEDGDETEAAPAVEVTGDEPNVEVNPGGGDDGGEDAPNAVPDDDDSRAPSSDPEPDAPSEGESEDS